MYSKIINPETGRTVNINGRLGKQILRNYVDTLNGGSSSRTPSLDFGNPGELDDSEKELLSLGINPYKLRLSNAIQEKKKNLKINLEGEEDKQRRQQIKQNWYNTITAEELKFMNRENICKGYTGKIIKQIPKKFIKNDKTHSLDCEQTTPVDKKECMRYQQLLKNNKEKTTKCKEEMLWSTPSKHVMDNPSSRRSITKNVFKKGINKIHKVLSPRRSF